MLPRVNHNLVNQPGRRIGGAIVNRDGVRYRASFDKLGSGANNGYDLRKSSTSIPELNLGSTPDTGMTFII